MKQSSTHVTAVIAAFTLLMVLMPGQAAIGKPFDDRFLVKLSGENEVPATEHGKADRVNARVTLVGDGEICVKFSQIKLTDGEALPVAGHIHAAPAGVNGPVVVHLFGGGGGSPAAPADYPVEVCSTAAQTTYDAILADPSSYYVNLHNPTHPAGVMRGQLG